MAATRFPPNERLSWLNRQCGLTYAAFRVLAVMIEKANDVTLECYPSKMRMERDLGFGKATIWRAVESLIEKGLIIDTGKRVGVTKQVSVWRLNISANGCADETVDDIQKGCADETVSDMKPFHSRNGKGFTGETKRVSPTQQEQVRGTSKKGTSKRESPSRSSSGKRAGTRLPDDFTVPTDWLEDVISKHGWTRTTANAEAQNFVDYFTVGEGKNRAWSDWRRAWMNWCRKPFAGATAKPAQPKADEDWMSGVIV